MDLKDARGRLESLILEIEKVIIGKREVVEGALIATLARGHLLIEDVPGTGKTMLARALSRAIEGSFRRIQFTPDLLPSDITGTAIYNQKESEFEFRPGPIFANIVLADEINRATPKTQSSLLEAMEEFQVTADGITRPLPSPFFVIATQNSVEYHGTFPLPESQLDRFVMRLSMGYPSPVDEVAILTRQAHGHPIDRVGPVVGTGDILALRALVQEVHVADAIQEYIVDLVGATRTDRQLALGASPRASLDLLHSSQAMAVLRGREYVQPDDVKRLAPSVLAHRVILHADARVQSRSAEDVIRLLMQQTPVPVASAA